jgi:hypothetical protein
MDLQRVNQGLVYLQKNLQNVNNNTFVLFDKYSPIIG